MIKEDIVLEKINSIQNCLKRIHDTVQNDFSRLYDLDVQDITVFNLQRAVQLTIDLAAHIVSYEKLSLPQNLKDTFRLLQTKNILSQDLSEKMQKMVGFRNIAVHDYQAIDIKILISIVKYHLRDIEDFYTAILMHYQA